MFCGPPIFPLQEINTNAVGKAIVNIYVYVGYVSIRGPMDKYLVTWVCITGVQEYVHPVIEGMVVSVIEGCRREY